MIEGQPVLFDEAAVTDVEILCYYAYSPLFQGDPDARRELLAGRCGLTIVPSSVTVLAGGNSNLPGAWCLQRFMERTGRNNRAHGADYGPCYTAGTLGGTFTVRATRTDGVPTSDTSTVRVVPAGSTPQSFLTSLWQGVLSPVTSTNVPVSCSPGGSTLPVFIVLRPGGGGVNPITVKSESFLGQPVLHAPPGDGLQLTAQTLRALPSLPISDQQDTLTITGHRASEESRNRFRPFAGGRGRRGVQRRALPHVPQLLLHGHRGGAGSGAAAPVHARRAIREAGHRKGFIQINATP